MFQSTRPMRGATYTWSSKSCNNSRFNPRAPCGARLVQGRRWRRGCRFNPRAPCGARRVGGDAIILPLVFQSTRPMRGATTGWLSIEQYEEVSIHAPHAGRDSDLRAKTSGDSGFNPRAPCGARQRFISSGRSNQMFQSTRPMRGATTSAAASPKLGDVSIHAPHAGRDEVHLIRQVKPNVSIHAPHAGRDRLRLGICI